MSLDPDKIRFILLAVVAMCLSGAIHEWAHAFTAVRLGDDTPARQGRLTLNPLVHIDPIGTLVMPIVGAYMGFLFGYMKPVEFSPVRLTRKLTMRMGVLLVALAGPVSNLILAFVCGALLKLIPAIAGPGVYTDSEVAHIFGALLFTGIWLNVVLFLFNLLPVYPLDGSRILEGLLPRRYHGFLEFMQRNSLLVMLFIFFIGVRFLARPIIELTFLIVRLFSIESLVGPFFRYFA